MAVIWQAKSLSVGFTQPLLTNVSTQVAEGEFIFLLGENGSGKSTLLRTLCGLQSVLHGSVQMNDQNIHSMSSNERAKYIALVNTFRPAVEGLSVEEVLQTGRYIHRQRIAVENEEVILHYAHLLQLEKFLLRKFGNLSDGEKQRVLVARALCQETPFIVMDEPTAFLDFKSKKVLMELLAQLLQQTRKTVIVSTHDLDHAEVYATRCWVLTDCQLQDCTPSKFREALSI